MKDYSFGRTKGKGGERTPSEFRTCILTPRQGFMSLAALLPINKDPFPLPALVFCFSPSIRMTALPSKPFPKTNNFFPTATALTMPKGTGGDDSILVMKTAEPARLGGESLSSTGKSGELVVPIT